MDTLFFKGQLLFPLALGIGPIAMECEHAKTRCFLTSFSTKDLRFLRAAHCADRIETGPGKYPTIPHQPDYLPQITAFAERPHRLDENR
ncbi:hypothetical protein [Rhizobium sp. BT03]|uniref:hypothetical protein n=1 Tax=Rhizobium sp. BT03 TaxID=3045156 RepID=UPI001805883B|nr:hypothetical protein [Rhizobium sp. BT03]WHO76528.1 hypothetical protein QMO80_005697 [Rhizobium sp. BT03]